MQTQLTLTLSRHAVCRFVERFRPGLDERRGALELERLVLQTEPPAWLAGQSGHRRAERYLVVGEQLVLVCEPDRFEPGVLCAVTCLSPGTFSERRREQRNRAGAHSRAARGVRGRRQGGRPRPREDWFETA